MSRLLLALPLLLMPLAGKANTPDCTGLTRTLPTAGTISAPLASELYSAMSDLGVPTGVLAQPADRNQSVDHVLLRLRISTCRTAALQALATPLDPNDPAAYKPRTAYDNTPWRFNMTQNGRRMTADEFDAWMRSRGIRIAGRNNAPAAAATSEAEKASQTPPAETQSN